MKQNKQLLSSAVLSAALLLAACGDDEKVAANPVDNTETKQEDTANTTKLFGDKSIAEETIVPKGETAEVQLIDEIGLGGDDILTMTAKQSFTILDSWRGNEALELYKKGFTEEEYNAYFLDSDYVDSFLKENPEYEPALVKLETTITDMKENGETVTELPLLDFNLLTFRSVESGNYTGDFFLDLPVKMRINPLQLLFKADEKYTGYLIGVVKKDEDFVLYHQAAIYTDTSSMNVLEPELNKNPITIFEVN